MSAVPISPPQVSAGDVRRNPEARNWSCPSGPSGVAAFHRALAGYAPTPLHDLPDLARELGVGRVLVKDESSRFGLPAFKALGVSYAVYRLICDRAGRAIHPAGWADLRDVVDTLPPLELITATDGNHGRAVARFAKLLGIPAHVFVPDVVAPEAIDAIRDEGARVTVLAENYDDTVEHAAAVAAERTEAELVQDTSWPGYELIPQCIVDGYSTLLAEVDEQAARAGAGAPDLVVVPMGVGSFAQAVITHYRSENTHHATLLGVEPETAACVQSSLIAGQPVRVPTASSIMAGLNCGTPSSLAWPYLSNGLDAVAAVSEQQAADAVEQLASLGVSSGPCGAAALAGVRALMAAGGTDALTSGATVVLLSTEGRPTVAPGESA